MWLSSLVPLFLLFATTAYAPPADCTPGQYKDQNGVCQNCQQGQVPNAAQNGCTACDTSNGYTAQPGDATCSQCQAGDYLPSGSYQCQQCSNGYYSSAGATSCTVCADGYISSQGSATCSPCAPGSTSQGAQSSCTLCSGGTYSDTYGAPSCTPCPAGQFQTLTGQTGCCECCQGWHGDSTGRTSCDRCDSGTPYGPIGATSSGQCSATQQPGYGAADQCSEGGSAGTCPAGLGPSNLPRRRRTTVQCTRSLKACPHFAGRGGLECVDVKNDPESCGGCVDPTGLEESEGQDCTAIPGVSVTECRRGKCHITKCRKNYTKSIDGKSCIPLQRFNIQQVRRTKPKSIF